jgi:hypothetical protein
VLPRDERERGRYQLITYSFADLVYLHYEDNAAVALQKEPLFNKAMVPFMACN